MVMMMMSHDVVSAVQRLLVATGPLSQGYAGKKTLPTFQSCDPAGI
jgi:hypothetical protein